MRHNKGAGGGRPAEKADSEVRVALSNESQRRAIIDQVSASIVDRIARKGPRNPFENELDRQIREPVSPGPEPNAKRENEFVYTMIDENNHKRTNTLPINGFQPATGEASPDTGEAGQ